MSVVVRLIGCLVFFGGILALFLEQNNRLMQLRIKLPQLEQEVAMKRDREQTLRYAIEERESPQRLLEASRKPEFAHLEFPR
ncbi:MAG: hypothetical protein AB7F31_06065 [Parachlamydiales bacterium]